MKKEIKNEYIERLYDDICPHGLEPRCCYCGAPDLEQGKQFCSERCENLFYEEMDVWGDREEVEYLKRKEEEK